VVEFHDSGAEVVMEVEERRPSVAVAIEVTTPF
jgi:hypothetical protein